MTTSELVKELQSKIKLNLKENEIPCTTCNGLRFTYVEENGKGYIDACNDCYTGKLYKCEFCEALNRTDWCSCEQARNKRDYDRVKYYYDKAKKIKYSEYKTKWLYDENTDRYYNDKEELYDYYDYNEIIYPIQKWVFACEEIPFVLNIDQALESASEEMYEDFDYTNYLTDIGELYDFIKKWNEKQSAKSYMVDYKTVVLLNE
jgi:hypothetical protein